MKKLILASSSPRRKELLEQIGISFTVLPANGDERIESNDPETVVRSLSHQKALEVVSNNNFSEPSLVLGADTVVAYNGQILGKPKNEADASKMLSTLQGNTHCVFTGLTFIDTTTHLVTTYCCKTEVTVSPMSEVEIKAYLRTGEPMDKAGAYAIQGFFAAFIEKIHGDYTNVVGLPLSLVYQHLKNATS